MPRPRMSPVMEAPEDEAPQYTALMKAEAAAALKAEFDREHPAEGERRPRKRHLTYWKMGTECPRDPCSIEGHNQRRGYIVIGIGTAGPFGDEQAVTFQRAIHGTSLEAEYGQYEQNNYGYPIEVGLNWTEYDENFPWGSFTEFFKLGGVFEMPIEQFFECGFHKNASLAQWRWEEIEALNLYSCEICHPSLNKVFLQEAHLNNHNEARHEELIAAKANAKETAIASSQVIGKMLLDHQMGNGTSPELIRQLAETQAQMAALAAQVEALQNQKGT